MGTTRMFTKILAPVDMAEPELTKIGIDEGVALAKASDGSLRLLYVQFFLPAAYADYVPTNFGEQLRLAAEQRIAEIADQIDYSPERISTVVRFGAVYPEVLAEASEWAADLIVLGSHRPSMATYLIGSNASVIVRHAKCSVLVARR
jgi:nucleotide-binding universal stress UspA family protein